METVYSLGNMAMTSVSVAIFVQVTLACSSYPSCSVKTEERTNWLLQYFIHLLAKSWLLVLGNPSSFLMKPDLFLKAFSIHE